MQITFDPSNSDECAVVANILENLHGAAPAKAAAPAKKAAAPAKKAAPEPEPDEDLLGGDDEPEAEVTMEDAVARATELVTAGKSADVKKALTSVGAKRVSEVKADKLAAFVAALG